MLLLHTCTTVVVKDHSFITTNALCALSSLIYQHFSNRVHIFYTVVWIRCEDAFYF